MQDEEEDMDDEDDDVDDTIPRPAFAENVRVKPRETRMRKINEVCSDLKVTHHGVIKSIIGRKYTVSWFINKRRVEHVHSAEDLFTCLTFEYKESAECP